MKRNTPTILLLAMLTLVPAFSNAWAATLEQLTGKVELRMEGFKAFRNAKTGDSLKPGDVIRTGVDGKAVLRLRDDSTLHFAQDSEFVLGKELSGSGSNRIGTLFRGVFRAVLNKRNGSLLGTPTGTIGIRGTDITVSHSGKTGFYFLDEGKVDIRVSGRPSILDAQQMTASFADRRPLPNSFFANSPGLEKARATLSEMTSVKIPSNLRNHAQLNEIFARWVINYAHYLADAGMHEHAETALLIAAELTERAQVEGEILLQIGGLYFYHFGDVEKALNTYRTIIREHHGTEHLENALFGAIRCFLLLGQQTKARTYGDYYKSRYPDGPHLQEVQTLLR